jgi:glycosyltransferase involved in cell wall biosynthesis
MTIVFFSNPDFAGADKMPHYTSMPRFTVMLAEGMMDRGHRVKIWSPGSTFFKLPVQGVIKKWLGYIDQYLIFPSEVRRRLKESPDDTLFVFTDQAQGPWVKLVETRKHVMHCHDFLAQFSALGKIPEYETSWTGKMYQQYIRGGYFKAKNFISVSHKTHKDLVQLIGQETRTSAVVYNGLDKSYRQQDQAKSRTILFNKTGIDLKGGFLMHVGGNQWYKNRMGVVEIYNAWRDLGNALPLLLIGAEPSEELAKTIADSNYAEDIHAISGLSDAYVRYAYSGASLFLFPSIAEGFGWPIVEAMASGCPVLTTGEAPMNEVAGNAGFFIPRRFADDAETWAKEAAALVQDILSLSAEDHQIAVEKSLVNATRFDMDKALNQIENIYSEITYP